MIIIKAAEKNLKEIIDLCKDCTQHLANYIIDQWDEIYPSESIFLEDIRNCSLHIAVCDTPGKIIGCIVLNDNQDPEYSKVGWKYTEGRIAVIHRLMVRPDFEGKGIGQKLLKHIESLAQKENYNSIRLDVFAHNLRAIKFYQRLDYQLAGQVNFRKGVFHCYEKAI